MNRANMSLQEIKMAPGTMPFFPHDTGKTMAQLKILKISPQYINLFNSEINKIYFLCLLN
jgi:hypothetical protein